MNHISRQVATQSRLPRAVEWLASMICVRAETWLPCAYRCTWIAKRGDLNVDNTNKRFNMSDSVII